MLSHPRVGLFTLIPSSCLTPKQTPMLLIQTCRRKTASSACERSERHQRLRPADLKLGSEAGADKLGGGMEGGRVGVCGMEGYITGRHLP